jgi:hypothetical protein
VLSSSIVLNELVVEVLLFLEDVLLLEDEVERVVVEGVVEVVDGVLE